jgi:hypothetical protein
VSGKLQKARSDALGKPLPAEAGRSISDNSARHLAIRFGALNSRTASRVANRRFGKVLYSRQAGLLQSRPAEPGERNRFHNSDFILRLRKFVAAEGEEADPEL